eukprot:gene39139-6596_t
MVDRKLSYGKFEIALREANRIRILNIAEDGGSTKGYEQYCDPKGWLGAPPFWLRDAPTGAWAAAPADGLNASHDAVVTAPHAATSDGLLPQAPPGNP